VLSGCLQRRRVSSEMWTIEVGGPKAMEKQGKKKQSQEGQLGARRLKSSRSICHRKSRCQISAAGMMLAHAGQGHIFALRPRMINPMRLPDLWRHWIEDFERHIFDAPVNGRFSGLARSQVSPDGHETRWVNDFVPFPAAALRTVESKQGNGSEVRVSSLRSHVRPPRSGGTTSSIRASAALRRTS
jgi:hypothetical protein